MQAWKDSFRTYGWEAALPTPELSTQHIRALTTVVA